MIVDWGVQKADELGLETFIVAETDVAIHLYEKAGYVLVNHIAPDMETSNPSEEWKACQKQLGKPVW